jgi:2-iminobutanoate/2-iminopropanoate deaminase
MHISGQLGINPESGKLVSGGIQPEVTQIFENMKHILAEVGGNLG